VGENDANDDGMNDGMNDGWYDKTNDGMYENHWMVSKMDLMKAHLM